MPSLAGSRRWLRWGLVAVVGLLAVLGGAVAFLLAHSPHNVSNPDVAFTTPTATAPTTPTTPDKKPETAVERSLWPRYGYDAERTHFFPGSNLPGPPLHVGWSFEDYAVLEFPPVIYRNYLYQIDDYASVKEFDKRTGRKLWETKVGTLAAASPALGIPQGLVFVAVLSVKGKSPGHGSFVALSMKTGRIVWSKAIPAGTESSPIAWANTVYFGDQAGTIYSLNAATGRVNWTFHASGAVKGGPALSNGILYFGDYTGRAYALNAANGHKIWSANTDGAQFGFGSGNFYSTPAVAFGRVYMGNTDGRVYSFSARTGRLAWATATGSYVYSSAAVDDTPGLGPTIYLGSYDGYFYAFNARTGAIRWKHRSGGRISGSPTIVGNVVYFSCLGTKTTHGLDLRTGREVFSFHDGAFNAVVADHSAIYLSGVSKLYQLLPKNAAARPVSARKPATKRKVAARKPATRRKVAARTAAAKRKHSASANLIPTKRSQRHNKKR